MAQEKTKKAKQPQVLWVVRNQEEQVVAVVWAKTAGGALFNFELSSGRKRDSYRAEKIQFDNYLCALSGELN